jgi:hypothetical protein
LRIGAWALVLLTDRKVFMGRERELLS